MSESTSVEREQEAPLMREAATGPLLPRWFTTLFYVIFIPFCVYSVFYITNSLVMQHRLRAAIAVVKGSLETEPVDLRSTEGQAVLEVLKAQLLESFLYASQELLQDEEKDERMARALALRRAIGWGKVSAERDVIERILDNMEEDGSVDAGFTVDEQMQQILETMVAERRADPEMTYVEDRITDVLEWVAQGHPGQPKGPERRRLAALQEGYAKKVFQSAEAEALRQLAQEWAADPNPVEREAAAAFAEMLAQRRAELSPEAEGLCSQQADRWEGLYHRGMVLIATIGRQLAAQLAEEGVFLDHPHIYQYVSLLNHRYDDVRSEVAAGTWLLRHNQFTIRFLSYFATKTTINPFLAVETVRLTREEHQRLMRHANNRRMREAVALLGRIGVDYISNSDRYDLGVSEPDQFVRRFIISALSEVADEEVISDLVETALRDMREADLARPGPPRFFEETA